MHLKKRQKICSVKEIGRFVWYQLIHISWKCYGTDVMINYEIKEEIIYSDEGQICLGPLQVIYPLFTF